MAPGEHAARAATPIQSPCLPLPSLPPPPLPLTWTARRDPLGDRDLRSHILSFPTKADHKVEKALQQDIESLQADTAHIGGRVEALESNWEETTPKLQAFTEKCKVQDRKIDSLPDLMDDFENQNRRVNIHIRGLPEAIAPRDIVPTLQGV